MPIWATDLFSMNVSVRAPEELRRPTFCLKNLGFTIGSLGFAVRGFRVCSGGFRVHIAYLHEANRAVEVETFTQLVSVWGSHVWE